MAAIDGLASGMNTTAIVNSLMAVEALPQTQLKTKLASNQSMITALQGLNTRMTQLQGIAAAASKPGALNLFTATSSNQSLTAATTTSATAGSIDVTITKLASTQVNVAAAMTAWPADGTGAPVKLTLVDGTGKQTEISPASTSLDDVVTAVNAGGGGASAVKVPAGNGTYRLQFTSTVPGESGAFKVYQGSAAEVTAGTATDLMTVKDAAVVKPAQNAEALLYAGTAAQVTISSATNTFKDLLPGVSVTATAISAAPVTVTVVSDIAGVAKKAEDLVKAFNDVLGFISDSSAVTTTATTLGTSTAKGGIFTGNSSVRGVNDALLSAMAAPVGGKSPSEYGIVISRNGDFTFDKDKLAASLAANPAGTQAALQEISARVAAAATAATDPFKGTVTNLIKGRQSESTGLTGQIADWDRRLADRQSTLQAVYSRMEVMLGGLQSQSAWLSGQLAGLTASSNSGN
ncbi:flagellar hook-associated protein 2 [Arthrobacter sp. B3I9]|uniref:flagellar filament capping protein FliD n=1 Tax=Arthrobacter sp. B3I9 TaxID=3042270 RepID=UPI00278EC8A1|nr:flagellar filament capping protein FliD [Arthrobacter sp. B3I9]MDQ0848288.1 flagellar hook-associated protein 2 [Arthrobacter sp. B3I9]